VLWRPLAAGLLLSWTAAAPATALTPEPVTSPELREALRELRDEPVVALPGAEDFDRERVLGLLPADGRVLLRPATPLGADRDDDDTYEVVSDWSDDQDAQVLLVTGVQVQLLGRGTVSTDELATMRRLLAHRDPTHSLTYAAEVLADPGSEDTERPPAVSPAAPDPALAEQVVAGLRTGPLWAAPGVTADFPDLDRWADLVPDLPLRVAFLPTVPRTAPFPDLLPAVRAAFPGELVVLVHGTWLEVGGPGQQEVESARNYALGAYETLLLSTDATQRQITTRFLERLGELRAGEAFRRPPVEPTTADELTQRLLPATTLLGAGALGGGSLVVWLRRRVRRARDDARGFTGERAGVLARLSRVSASLVEHPGGAPADAAERHAMALQLYEQAERSRDREVLQAAGRATAEAERLLAEVRA
jgi:hypothetical protein